MLSTVFASSAVAFAGLLVAAPASVDALVVTPLGGSNLGHLAARHPAGVSPNHQAIARRKRTVHKNRKRCQQRPQPSNNSGGNNNGDNYNDANNSDNNDNNNNNNNNNNNTPPATTPAGTTPAVTTPAVTTPAVVPPVTTPPSNGPSNTGKKLILAWPNQGDPSIANSEYFTGNAAWYYTWSPAKVPNDGGIKFCPMLWGDHQIGDFQRLVTPGYSDCVLGMNEPNQHDQSNMDVDHGAYLWNTYIGPLANQGYTMLGSPAPTSAPDGLVWVKAFLDKVSVKPTHICLHYYDISASDFQKYVTNFYDGTGNRPILVTEYACQNFNGGPQCDNGQVWSFVKDTTTWMDQTSWIEGYAPFGFMRNLQGVNTENALMTGEGHITDLGNYFVHH